MVFEIQKIQEESPLFLNFITLEVGTDMLSRSVGKVLSTYAA